MVKPAVTTIKFFVKKELFYAKLMWRLFLFRFSTKFRKRASITIHGAMALVILGSLIMPLISFGPKAQAASAGPRYATASGDCVNQTGVGTVAWTSPGDAFSSNNTNASASLGTATTNYLKCTNFGFTLPYSNVNGITVQIERTASANNRIFDSEVKIVKSGTIQSTNKADAASWPNTETTQSYGSTSDTWGTTWAYTDINAANFGAVLAATRSAGGSSTASVDSIAITVQYTPLTDLTQSSYRWFENADATETTEFAETLGGTGSDYGNAITIDSSGNYIITGRTESYGAGSADMFISKFNGYGVEQWTKTWGGTSIDQGDAITTDASGNYIVTGLTNSYGVSGDMFITKFDSSGVEQWSKTWGGTGGDWGKGITTDASGNYIVTGYTASYGAGGNDMFITKFNSSGVEQWSKTWGSTSNDSGSAITTDSSGNYIIIGYTESYGAGSADMFITKFDSSGVEQWSKTWGGTGGDYGYSITTDSAGNYIVTGYTSSYDDLTWGDIFITKFNSSGVEQWSKTWGGTGNDYGRAITTDSAGNYIVTGETASYGAGSSDMFITKFNSSGVEQWSKTWGGTGNDNGYGIIIDTGGNYIVTGATASYGAGGNDMFISKHAASNGDITNCVSCQTQAITEANQTVTEANQTVTEANQAITEGNITISEADQSPIINIICGESSFAKTWGGTGTEYGYAVTTDASGSYIVTGRASSFGAGGNDMYITKFNSSGVEQWSKTWGGTGSEYGKAITTDASGNYIVIGETTSYGAGGNDMFITKFNSSGVEQWSKTWGGTGSEYGYGITTDASGNYIVTGLTTSYGAGLNDMLITKFNSSGVEQWSKTWGGAGSDIGYAITTDASGDYIVTGETTSYGAGSNDMFITKFNSSGVEQWSKTWGGTDKEYGYAITTDAIGNYIVTGEKATSLADSSDMFITKFNSSGVEQWSKTWGSTSANDYGKAVTTDASGNYIVAGYTESYGAGGTDMFITKFNSSGVEQWSKTWGGTYIDQGYGITTDTGGNYIMTGSTTSYGAGGYDMFITKHASSSGDIANCASCQTQTITEADQTITEANQTITEADQTITEANQTITEADQTITEGNVCAFSFIIPSIDVGAPLNSVAQNTATTALGEQEIFRLRLLLHASTVAQNDELKLQYAAKSGTCDTSFTGETYNDVTTTSPIAYADNPNAVDGAPLTTNANGPTHSTDNVVAQEYNESNNTTLVNSMASGEDGMFDFALKDNGAPAETSYCFRIARFNDDLLNTYSVIPEITTQPVDFDQSGYRWFKDKDSNSFAQTWGGNNIDYATSTAVDSSGNIYVAGYTNSTGLSSETTYSDMSLVKYDSAGVEQWSKSMGGDGWDRIWAIELDADGNIYAAGQTNSTGLTGGVTDLILVKFNSLGQEQWTKTWGGDGTDQANDIALDTSGNIYVVGSTNSTGITSSGYDHVLIKFNSSGQEQWSKTWGGDGTFDDARGVALDASGNIYVVGQTDSTGFTSGGSDQTLIKYNSSGQEQWTKTLGGDGTELMYEIALDNSTNIYVIGQTNSTGLTSANNDQLLIKYDSSGQEQWTKTWGGDGSDSAYAMALDDSGNIYVAGDTNSTGLTSGDYDQTLIKYNSSGQEQWTKTWGGSGTDSAKAISLDSGGNILVAGYTASTGLTIGSNDQSLLMFDNSGNIASCASCVDRTTSEVDRTISETDRTVAEVDHDMTEVDRTTSEVNRNAPSTLVHCGSIISYQKSWSTIGGTYNSDVSYAIKFDDATGDIITVGSSDHFSGDGTDYATLIKYNNSGQIVFSGYEYDGLDNLEAYDVALDTSGNIYFVGYLNDSAPGGKSQIVSKYNSSGEAQWGNHWSGNNDDVAYSLTLDNSGNIYVAGQTKSTGITAGLFDQSLVKYDSSGVEQWSKTWGGTGNDTALNMTIDDSGNLYVVGESNSAGLIGSTSYDMTLVKYNSSGVEQWSKTWGGDGWDTANAITLDSSGNIYITGETDSTELSDGSSYGVLVKFNSSGVEQWAKTWAGVGRGIAVDNENNIYVAGTDLLKFNSSGVAQWTKSWEAVDIDIDNSGNIYLAGNSGYNQTLIKTTSNASDCGGLCYLIEGNVIDHTGDATINTPNPGEVDRTVSDGFRTYNFNIVSEELLTTNQVYGITHSVEAIAAQDTSANLDSHDLPLHLRILLDPTKAASINAVSVKLQYAPKVGTCDAAFTGETYVDIGSGSGFSYYNNPNFSNGNQVTSNADDPTDGNSIILQSYVKGSPFSNPVLMSVTGDSGLWDIILTANAEAYGGSYCFRVVQSDGTPLVSYSQIPELYIPPGMFQKMRHGQWFDAGGTKQPMFW